MSRPPRGGSLQDLFASSYVPHTTDDGREVLRYVLCCRVCCAVCDRDDPMATVHHDGCRVGALIARWQHEGNSAAVVDEYDAILDQLDQADRPPAAAHKE